MTLQITIFGFLLIFALALLNKQRTLVSSIPYPSISDAWLKTLLGFSDKEYLPNGVLLKSYEPLNVDNEEMNYWKLYQKLGEPIKFSISKRKNAELVNHILKNFASINRLGDAGK